MLTQALEIERKYDLDGSVDLPLDGLPGVASVAGPRHHDLEAVYYDTADLRLAGAGVTLRRRTGGTDAGWHLKLPAGAPGERVEHRLPPGRGRTVPKELVDLTLARTRGMPLGPVARLRTARTQWDLVGDDGAVLAEVVSDEVSAQTMGESTTMTAWHELEVELAGGRRDLLDAVEARLRDAGARPSDSTSKLGRVLADQLAAAASDGSSSVSSSAGAVPRSAADAVLGYLRTQLEEITRRDPLVRKDEPDSVHRMRIAARRARSTLQSFRGVLDRERTADLVGELKWLGAVLAGARDAEVQRGRLATRLRALPSELVVGPVVSRVDAHFFREYTRAHETVVVELRGQRYLALLDALHELLADPPLTPRATKRAKAVLPGEVARAQRRVRRALDRYDALGGSAQDTGSAGDAQDTGSEAAALGAAPDGDARDTALHDARKAAKRARYAAEAAATALDKPAHRSAKRLKAVQGLLGDFQDAVVARAVLRDLGMRAHIDGENAFTHGVLLGREIERADALRARLPQVWHRADSGKARRWLRG